MLILAAGVSWPGGSIAASAAGICSTSASSSSTLTSRPACRVTVLAPIERFHLLGPEGEERLRGHGVLEAADRLAQLGGDRGDLLGGLGLAGAEVLDAVVAVTLDELGDLVELLGDRSGQRACERLGLLGVAAGAVGVLGGDLGAAVADALGALARVAGLGGAHGLGAGAGLGAGVAVLGAQFGRAVDRVGDVCGAGGAQVVGRRRDPQRLRIADVVAGAVVRPGARYWSCGRRHAIVPFWAAFSRTDRLNQSPGASGSCAIGGIRPTSITRGAAAAGGSGSGACPLALAGRA